MIKEIKRVFLYHTTNGVVFYSYYSSGKPVYIGYADEENIYDAAEVVERKLPGNLRESFITAFLRAAERYKGEQHLVIEGDPMNGIIICEQNGDRRVAGLPNKDLWDLVEFLNSSRRWGRKINEFAEDTLNRLFCGTRRFNNKRQK